MMISCVAEYKEEARRLISVNQSPQNGLIFDGLQKACQASSAEDMLIIPRRFMIRWEKNLLLSDLNRDLIERR